MTTKKHKVDIEEGSEPHAEAADPSSSLKTIDVIIPAGQSMSEGVDFGAATGASIEYIIMPAAWTPAHLSFMGSFDGEGYYDLFSDQNVEVMVTNVNPKSMVDVSNRTFNVKFIKFRSGTRNAPKNQTEERKFTLVIVS